MHSSQLNTGSVMSTEDGCLQLGLFVAHIQCYTCELVFFYKKLLDILFSYTLRGHCCKKRLLPGFKLRFPLVIQANHYTVTAYTA